MLIGWFDDLAQDLRYAWRGLRQSPAFVATTVLTLGVGLGLVTVSFTVFNAYVLRPFAVRDPSICGYSDVVIVGVVRDVVSGMLFDGHDTGHIYLPASAADSHAVALLVRGRSERDLGPETLQRLFEQVGSDPQAFEALSLEEMKKSEVRSQKSEVRSGVISNFLLLTSNFLLLTSDF
jgi:hypothetical protein